METGKQTDYVAPKPGETIADYRDRIAQRKAEAIEQRQRELAEQTSEANTPAVRIRIWERLHQLSLPRSSNHRVLGVIAAKTGLSLEEVRAEQRQRSLLATKTEP